MCSGSFSQNIVNTTDKADTQEIGDDVLALCTGNFYDSKFVSQLPIEEVQPESSRDEKDPKQEEKTTDEKNLLNSILLELDDPDFNDPKPKYFQSSSKANSDSKEAGTFTQQKKRLIIDSDEEAMEPTEEKRPKKLKKKKLKDRALQISGILKINSFCFRIIRTGLTTRSSYY